MKNIFLKIFFTFAFILTFIQGVCASTLNISSVVYDNSSSFLVINSFDNEDFKFSQKPSFFVDNEGKKAYIDLYDTELNCPLQNIVLNSPYINQITVSQHSRSPEIVRIAFAYNDGFNPDDLRLKKLNNTLFLTFKSPTMSNYYFQGVYQEAKYNDIYENIAMQTPVQINGSVLGQINSAFDIDKTKNYILVKKNLQLLSKYYLDNISISSGRAIITGVGSYTLSKPFYLSNPSRLVVDLQNTIVNPSLRNKTIDLAADETIKIGQFDKNTARIVITSKNPGKYIPVVYSDSQKLVFIDKASPELKNTLDAKITMTSAKYDRISSDTHALKLIFNSPLILGVDRKNDVLDLNLFNVGNSVTDIVKKAVTGSAFSNVLVSDIDSGNVKLSLSLKKDSIMDIHLGSDGKTLRIREKSFTEQKPLQQDQEIKMPQINIPDVVPALRKDGKKYVVIDAGHGGSDCGALRGSINEKEITLDVAKRVEKLLSKKGYVVTMTRSDDSTVSLQERVDISEAVQPDIFVSIHVNSSNSDSPNGLETHYYKDNSLRLAKTVHAAMLNNINSNDRGLFKSKFYVINHTTAPAILVEIGFLSNPKERAQLVSETRKEATAKAIAEGIDDYFRQ
ncbi:N-acetylmuramoyl-L-alanine amidase [bacterium]|nr:N-acetylmuramoyl-L-alanine amidase [bacterium]